MNDYQVQYWMGSIYDQTREEEQVSLRIKPQLTLAEAMVLAEQQLDREESRGGGRLLKRAVLIDLQGGRHNLFNEGEWTPSLKEYRRQVGAESQAS